MIELEQMESEQARTTLPWGRNMPAVYILIIELIKFKMHLSACSFSDTWMTSPVGAPGAPSTGMLGMAGFLSAGGSGCCWMGLKGAGTPADCGGSCCG